MKEKQKPKFSDFYISLLTGQGKSVTDAAREYGISRSGMWTFFYRDVDHLTYKTIKRLATIVGLTPGEMLHMFEEWQKEQPEKP